jgi:adenylate cyclase
VGSAVNLASRIESTAEPGTVYISEDTYLLVREKFASLPVNKVTPKGISQPVQLYKALMEEAAEGVQTLSQDGFQLQYQPELLTAESREQLRLVLEKITRESSP